MKCISPINSRAQLQVSFADFCKGYGTVMTVKGSNADEADSSDQQNNVYVISDETYVLKELTVSSDGNLLC